MKIYIGNLPSASVSDLKDLFEPFGSVQSVTVNMNKSTYPHRFFGYVEMPRIEEGRAAIAALNTKKLDGFKIVVLEVTGK